MTGGQIVKGGDSQNTQPRNTDNFAQEIMNHHLPLYTLAYITRKVNYFNVCLHNIDTLFYFSKHEYWFLCKFRHKNNVRYCCHAH